MDRKKFDRVLAFRMINDEKRTMTETAKLMGVSKSSISRAMRELKPAITTQTALEASHKIVSSHLDTLSQLQKINSNANEILDTMMKWQRGDPGAIRVLESQVREIMVGRGEKTEKVEMFKIKDPREMALKAMAEIREQLNLQVSIMKTLYDVNAVAEFQKHVLETIGRANLCVNCGEELICAKCGTKVNLRAEIVLKLKEERALRAGVQFKT